MQSNGWFPRALTPYISAADKPHYRLLYASWYWKALLQYVVKLNRHARVLELLPGRTATLSLALESLGFQGTYDRIDLSPEMPEHRSLSFRGSIITMDALDILHNRYEYDVIIGNHILDDLILHLYGKEVGSSGAASREGSASSDVWTAIADGGSVGRFADRLSTFFTALLDGMRPGGALVLRHYPSTFELRTSATRRIRLLEGIFSWLAKDLAVRCFPSRVCRPSLDLVPGPRGEKYPYSVLVLGK
jgi:hypothetical protein